MNISKNIYTALAVIFLCSLTVLLIWPNVESIKAYATIPLVGSLAVALFQILRDQTAHMHSLIAIEKQNHFTLGISSHMANHAFNKHVEFAEEYLKEVHSTLTTLSSEGPTTSAMTHANNLMALRDQYALWLTKEIDTGLGKFEKAIRNIGSSAHYTAVAPLGGQFEVHHSRQYKLYAEFMGFTEWEGEVLSEENASSALIDKLRDILGSKELTELRSRLLKSGNKNGG